MGQSGLAQRIEYIDLAKGFCILLVISVHIDMSKYFYANEQVANYFRAFRMPLYYILSGFFLSIKNGDYAEFIQKKINRLIVPFIFFVIMSNLYFYIRSLIIHSPYQYISPLSICFTENPQMIYNGPIWFLISLFNTYIIFAFLHYIFNGKVYKICIASLGLGFAGYMLGKYKINIPFYFDTSLSCIPFVCIGMLIRRIDSLNLAGG